MTVQSSQQESKPNCSLNFNPGLMWGVGEGGAPR